MHPKNFIYDFSIFKKSLMDPSIKPFLTFSRCHLLCQCFLMIILIAAVWTLHFPAAPHMRGKDYGLHRRNIPLTTILTFIISNLSLKFKAVVQSYHKDCQSYNYKQSSDPRCHFHKRSCKYHCKKMI